MSGRGSVYRRGATWTAHVKWQHQGGWKQRKKGGHRTRRDAEQALTEMLGQLDLGVAVPADKLTVAGFLDGWLDHLEHVVGRKRSTVHGYRQTLLAYAVPAIGEMRVQKVTAADLDGIYRAMSRRGLSPRTVRYLYSILRKAFGDAERKGIVATNVVTRSTPPSTVAAKAPTFSIWTWDELGSFLDHIDGRPHAAAITFAAFTGVRRGEVIGLRWSDVDLEHRQAVIVQTVTEVGSELVVGTTKSHRSRPVGLDDELVALLRRHRVAHNEWRLTMGRHWIDRDLVFPDAAGDFVRPETLSQQFDRLVATAGVPRIRFHDLRHTHATLLAEDGKNPKLISERLGHATVAFTLDRYVKVSTDTQIEAANDFSRRLRRSS